MESLAKFPRGGVHEQRDSGPADTFYEKSIPVEAPEAYHVLAKPTGAICNLDCQYCFFLSKEGLYPGSKFRMKLIRTLAMILALRMFLKSG
jgi:sulfatase maturation enzyme AslB (radical SAM superfamily)